jgi:hypothetical protein
MDGVVARGDANPGHLTTHSARCHRRRRLLALVGHAPALWLCYRQPLPRPLWRPNAIAALATLAAMLAAMVAASWTLLGVAFAVGHMGWGAYLAWRLPNPPRGHARAAHGRLGHLLFGCDHECRAR